jgi:hypothetical protein
MAEELSRIRRLLWLGIIGFLVMLSIPLFFTVFIEPARTGHLLVYGDGRNLKISDYVNFYYAGWMARSADRLRVYDPEVRMETSNRLIAPHRVGEPLYTGYLPIVFPMMVPFALLGLTESYFLWLAVTFGFGVSMLALFGRRVMNWPWRYVVAFSLFWLWSLPGFLTLHLGQVVWLLLGLDLLFFWGLLTGRDLAAGISLALTFVKPQYSVFLLAAAIGAKRWKLVGISVLTLAALFGLAALTIGWENVVRYPTLLHHTEQSDYTARVMASIRPVLYAVLPPAPALQANLAVWVGSAIGIAVLWLFTRAKGEEARRWLSALTILAALATSPHTHCHDLLLIAAAALMTLDITPGRKRSLPELLWIATLFIYPIAGFAFYIMPVGAHLSRWPFVLTNFILLTLCAICYWRAMAAGVSRAEADVRAAP